MTAEPTREKCYACGKMVALYFPSGGDGSLRIFRLHRKGDRRSPYCEGSHGPEDKA